MTAALVTGGGRGLGAAIAGRLADEGFAVVVGDIDGEAAADTAASITETGGEAVAVEADVASDGAADTLVDRAVSEYGCLDVLVNNAAIETVAPALELTDDEWERVRSVNLDAVFRLSRAAGRRFREQGDGGDIVNITSFHDTWPRTGKIHYDTAKAGVWMLTKDFALELAEHGVAVNCIAPGVMATPMNEALQNDPEAMAEQRERIPWGRLGDPEEVADAVAFLIDSNYITGVRLPVDGGVSLVG
ncbi:SDR family NAD(P)-dependent oxidoreductase [Natronomonas sp.]|uniref:SDR family NAD(P)-dependent oxidoreductase n=1 Tax=Natronomonas sp. TaxID=2184060 RepID=UPI002FC2CAD4